jgi:hypothetical protein
MKIQRAGMRTERPHLRYVVIAFIIALILFVIATVAARVG